MLFLFAVGTASDVLSAADGYGSAIEAMEETAAGAD